MASFESIFPTFLAKCAELHELLLVVAFLLFIIGIITTVSHGVDPPVLFLYLVRLTVLTTLLVYLPAWGNTIQDILQSSILNGLGVDPTNVHDQYTQLLAIKRDTGTGKSWWDMLSDLNGMVVEKLISGVLWLAGFVASLMLYWAYIFQKIILHLGYALSPMLIGMMAIPPLRSIGEKYLMNLVGVLLWPFGWAAAAMVSQAILDFMTDSTFKFMDVTGISYGLQNTMGVAVLGFWIIFSTIAAPTMIQHMLASGILAGGQMFHDGIHSFFQSAATTASAAAVAAPSGSPITTAGAVGLAATLSAFSTSANMGSAGSIIIAGSGLPPRSARGRPGDDITNDQAVRDLIAKSRNPHV